MWLLARAPGAPPIIFLSLLLTGKEDMRAKHNKHRKSFTEPDGDGMARELGTQAFLRLSGETGIGNGETGGSWDLGDEQSRVGRQDCLRGRRRLGSRWGTWIPLTAKGKGNPRAGWRIPGTSGSR